MNIKRKLTSRKFWLTVASMLASIGVAITGAFSGNEIMVFIGVICNAVSSAIYTIAEAAIDNSTVPTNDD